MCLKIKCSIEWLSGIYCSNGSVVEIWPRERKVVGLIPDPVIPTTLFKMALDASLLSAQHIMIGLAFLSSQKLVQDSYVMDGRK